MARLSKRDDFPNKGEGGSLMLFSAILWICSRNLKKLKAYNTF
jgi:hypothetical protein